MQEPIDARQLLRLGEALRAAGYAFVTPSNATVKRVNARAGNGLARDAAGQFGWGRPVEEGAQLPWLEYVREARLAHRDGQAWRSALRAATLGQDLLFHTSGPGAAPDAVFFGPDSYRFVRALELELAARPQHCARALDLGCGAGAAAITLARHFPHAQVLATDINPKALQLAEVNATLAGCGNIAFRHSDLYESSGGGYDLIAANPPFIADPAGRTYRNGGGADGLDTTRRIIDGALDRLAPGGALMLYTAVAVTAGQDPLLAHVRQQLRGSGVQLAYSEIDPDVFGELLSEPPYREADRLAAVWLVLRKPSM